MKGDAQAMVQRGTSPSSTIPLLSEDAIHEEVIQFIQSLYSSQSFIALHEPRFLGKEKEYVNAAIDSTFVSSSGAYVDRFEKMLSDVTGSHFAVATINGTAALHIALRLSGVGPGDEVITQSLSFVATANAITYCGARPIFLDVEAETLGLSPVSLNEFLRTRTLLREGVLISKATGRRIAACVPVHVFGHPCRIDRILEVCGEYGLPVVEDAAEALGSHYQGIHAGRFARLGALSFNGNKIVTCGGGGAILTDDADLAKLAKHVTTTAKVPHPYEYVHDQVGYNYRMPNLNAAMACAQLEQLDSFVENKRELAYIYEEFFRARGIPFVHEPSDCRSNYWLNAILLSDRRERDLFLERTNKAGVMTRPLWKATCDLHMYRNCEHDSLETARNLEERVVNLPSSVRICKKN